MAQPKPVAMAIAMLASHLAFVTAAQAQDKPDPFPEEMVITTVRMSEALTVETPPCNHMRA